MIWIVYVVSWILDLPIWLGIFLAIVVWSITPAYTKTLTGAGEAIGIALKKKLDEKKNYTEQDNNYEKPANQETDKIQLKKTMLKYP